MPQEADSAPHWVQGLRILGLRVSVPRVKLLKLGGKAHIPLVADGAFGAILAVDGHHQPELLLPRVDLDRARVLLQGCTPQGLGLKSQRDRECARRGSKAVGGH